MRTNLIRIILKYILLPLIILVSLTYIIYLALSPIKTVYNIDVTTEKAKCKINDIALTSFNIYNAEILDEELKTKFKKFTGNFRFDKTATVEYQRISNGPFIVSIYNDSIESVGGFFHDEELKYKAKNRVDIIFNKVEETVKNGNSIVIPISGQIESGDDIAGQVEYVSSPVLRGGTVTMAGYSKLSDSYFNAGEEKLFMGDRLIFENDTLVAFGFINVTEEPAFRISYRVEADKATVLKPGPRAQNSGYIINATIYDRLLNDGFFQSISLTFAILVIIATIGSFVMDFIKFNREENG